MKNKQVQFSTTLLQAGKTATGIRIPDELVESLGSGKRPPVKVTINNRYTYRNTVAVMGGAYMVGVSAEHRLGAGVAGGDKIQVRLELDMEPRVAEVPKDFQAALNTHAVAKQNFESLSYSGKQALLIPVKEAKSEETRKKRIEKAIATLKEKKIKK